MDKSLDGIVIVSMSNLFHIFDKERATTIRKKKVVKDFFGFNKKATRGGPGIGQSLLQQTHTDDQAVPCITNPNYPEKVEKIEKTSNKKEEYYEKTKKSSYCDYFFNLVLICFIAIFLNWCYLWIFIFMHGSRKNNTYCFESDSREFKLCESDSFCPISGIREIIYTDESSKEKILDELVAIKEKYIDFYVKETTVFSRLNSKYSKKESTMSKYGVTIISTYGENYLFINTFRTGCDNYLLNFMLVMTIAIIIGNLFFGHLADVKGRKTTIVLSTFIEIVGCLILIITSLNIIFCGSEEYNDDYTAFNNDKMFAFDYTYYDSYSKIQSYIKDFNLDIFELTTINEKYQANFNKFKREVLHTKYIKYHFQKKRIIIFISFFIIFFCNSSVKTTNLSYLVENALTEDSMNLYFLYFNFCIPLSLIFSSYLITLLNSFVWSYAIIVVLQLITIILFCVFFWESQRFHFEYALYTRITLFTKYILGEENLKRNYSGDYKNLNDKTNVEKEKIQINIYYSRDSKDLFKIQSELSNNDENDDCSFLRSILYINSSQYKNKSNFFYSKGHRIKMKRNVIKRKNALGDIYYLFKFLRKEKQLKKHFVIIMAFICSLSIVVHLSLIKVNSSIFISRDSLVQDKILNYRILLLTIIYFLMLYPFLHYFIKCIGLGIILALSLTITIVFSCLYEFFCLSSRELTDLSESLYNSIEIVIKKHNTILTICVLCVCISCAGLQYSLYFYLTKLTKTIYRCSFYGICHVFIDFTFVISLFLEATTEKTYAFACLFSIIALISSCFLTSNEDSINITDYREIKFDDKTK